MTVTSREVKPVAAQAFVPGFELEVVETRIAKIGSAWTSPGPVVISDNPSMLCYNLFVLIRAELYSVDVDALMFFR